MSAPDISMPQDAAPPDIPQAPAPAAPVLNESGTPDGGAGAQGEAPPPPSGGSRLGAILSAVAKVASTGMAGIPTSGRPSFANGLGQGARASQAAQATQQDIKFKTFQDQIAAANLHHQDQELQLRTQEQTDAHQKFQDFQHDWNDEHGIETESIPNSGAAAMDHLAAQTAAGGAQVPPGTHLSADGSTIHMPTDTQQTKEGQLAFYNSFRQAYALPALPKGAQIVPSSLAHMLQYRMEGYAQDGTPIQHEQLPTAIANLQTQRDQLAKGGNSTPEQLKAMDLTLGILNSNQKALDTHAATQKQALEAKPPVDTSNVQTFVNKVLPGYEHMSPGVANGLKAEALQAKSQEDLDKVQTKALTMEQSGQVHADTVAATQANKDVAQSDKALEANEKLINDPHSGYLGTAQQISQARQSIKAGMDGNAFLTNMIPTMEVLGINHAAGITRVPPTEAEKASKSPDLWTRLNAFASAASTGKFTPELAKQGNQLMDILQSTAHDKLLSQQKVLVMGRKLNPATVPSVDAQGTVTTLDKVMPPTRPAGVPPNATWDAGSRQWRIQ